MSKCNDKVSSGPSGRGKQPRSNVDSAKLQRLRELLSLRHDATPNATLDATIEHLEQPLTTEIPQ